MKNLTLREKISQDLMIPESMLDLLIKRAPYSYKVYTIPKRTKGRREIAQPAKVTKYLQLWLIDKLFSLLPVHDAATAYKVGASIRDNASRHSKNQYLSKYDFKDFFTSIKASNLENHLFRHLGDVLGAEDIADAVRISCIKHKGRDETYLSIGAPSSPILSNSVMFEFDSKIALWCDNNGVIYTRYADDLTFSTNIKGLSNAIEPAIRTVLSEIDYPSLRFNRKKTIHLSKKNQRRVTGLILTNDGKVSLGRDRKREISSLIHKFSHNLLDAENILRLQGLLAFAKDIEPLFLSRMRGKYSSKLIEEILKKRKH